MNNYILAGNLKKVLRTAIKAEIEKGFEKSAFTQGLRDSLKALECGSLKIKY